MSVVTETTNRVKPVRKPRKPAGPVSGTCRWLIEPLAVRDFESGVLAINGSEYVVTMPQDRSGARLTKDADVYHVDLTAGKCDCPDSQYTPRPGGCKHFKAVKAAVSVLPVRQKHTACPRCQAYCDAGQVCDQCQQAEDEYHTAAEQLAEMEAGGLDTFEAA